MVSTPPAYEVSFPAASQPDVFQSLPGYTRTVNPEWEVPAADQRHTFNLTAKKTGERWLTLSVTSRAASAAGTPTFYQGGDVSGSLELHLDKEELVDGITITVSVATYTELVIPPLAIHCSILCLLFWIVTEMAKLSVS